MYVIVIMAFFAGVPHGQSEWNEHYSTMAECRNAIPVVAVQFRPEAGVTFTFSCVKEERGA